MQGRPKVRIERIEYVEADPDRFHVEHVENVKGTPTFSFVTDFPSADPDAFCKAVIGRTRLVRPTVFPTTAPSEPITTTDGGAYTPVQEQRASWWDRLWARVLDAAVIGSSDG